MGIIDPHLPVVSDRYGTRRIEHVAGAISAEIS
jgi:hypothetical protein